MRTVLVALVMLTTLEATTQGQAFEADAEDHDLEGAMAM